MLPLPADRRVPCVADAHQQRSRPTGARFPRGSAPWDTCGQGCSRRRVISTTSTVERSGRISTPGTRRATRHFATTCSRSARAVPTARPAIRSLALLLRRELDAGVDGHLPAVAVPLQFVQRVLSGAGRADGSDRTGSPGQSGHLPVDGKRRCDCLSTRRPPSPCSDRSTRARQRPRSARRVYPTACTGCRCAR